MELLTINGWVRTVCRPEDFEALIREHMGDDAAAFMCSWVRNPPRSGRWCRRI